MLRKKASYKVQPMDTCDEMATTDVQGSLLLANRNQMLHWTQTL